MPSSNISEEKLESLIEAFLATKNVEEVKSFLKDLLTRSELETLILRWQVAKMLDEGIPYTKIEEATGASSATIAKVSEFLKYGYNGYRIIIDRLKGVNS